MMSPALLRAMGVQKKFGAVVAAADMNIDISVGERVSLIGSNGAGKTSFINMITGYLKPDTGRIELDGQNITPLQPRDITHLGVARSFQIPQLYGGLTALENMLVAICCSARRASLWHRARDPQLIERADDLLLRFGLDAHRDRPANELPGGVRKLLDIAMALTGSPKLLLLDEPTSAVSSEEKFPMMETIMTAWGELPLTVLFVEHDMDIVERYASRVVAFYSGRIIADADPAQALASADVRRYVTGEEVAA